MGARAGYATKQLSESKKLSGRCACVDTARERCAHQQCSGSRTRAGNFGGAEGRARSRSERIAGRCRVRQAITLYTLQRRVIKVASSQSCILLSRKGPGGDLLASLSTTFPRDWALFLSK